MKRINIVKCQIVKEKTMTYDFKTISTPADAVGIIKAYIGNPDRENFVLACLDTRNNITAINTVSIGNLNSSITHPREIFKVAILANSASIIVAHNHPTGDPTPSQEDLRITKRIVDAGNILGIQVLDHIIVSDDGEQYVSLKEKGLM